MEIQVLQQDHLKGWKMMILMLVMVLCSISEQENSRKTMVSILSTWTSGEKTKTAFSSFSLREEEGFPYFPPPHKKKKHTSFDSLANLHLQEAELKQKTPRAENLP